MKKVGFIGLGTMGSEMAKQLLQAEIQLTVFNRNRAKAEPLAVLGAKVAGSVAECAQNQDVVITMLPNDQVVTDVLTSGEGVYRNCQQGAIVIDMSTVTPQTSIQLAHIAREHGLTKMDAPVSGSVNLAREGNLVILVGGEKQAYQQLVSLFEMMGKTSYYFGEAGKGSQAKLVINLFLGVTMQGLAESLILAEKFGLDRSLMYEMIQQSQLASPFLSFKKEILLNEEYDAAFALKHMHKDMGYMLDESRKTGGVLPATSAAYQTYTSAMNHQLQDLDLSAVFKELLQQSGIGQSK